MTRETFRETHRATWDALRELLDAFDARRERRLTPLEIARFDALYRRVCQHLALARQRLYGADLVEELNALALRAHHRLYGPKRGHAASVVRFLTHEFPGAVARHVGAVAIAALAFVVPTLVSATLVGSDGDRVTWFLSPDTVRSFEEMYEPGAGFRSRERRSSTDVAMFGFYVWNNVSIAFRTYAGGLAAGVGSLFVLAFNGVYLGAVGAHIVNAGLSGTFFSFVSGHAALELTAIALAGAAGLLLGKAVIAPGRLGRSHAVRLAGRESVRIAIGAFAMLVGAACVEAFWSASESVPPSVKYAVGALMWVAVFAYLAHGRRVARNER